MTRSDIENTEDIRSLMRKDFFPDPIKTDTNNHDLIGTLFRLEDCLLVVILIEDLGEERIDTYLFNKDEYEQVVDKLYEAIN